MKPVEFMLIGRDGTTRTCRWAPWFHINVYPAPAYDEDLKFDLGKALRPSEYYQAYGVFERDSSWDPDSDAHVLHFPPLDMTPGEATYIIRPGDTVVHDDFRLTLRPDMHSYNVLDTNLRTLYELQ